MTFLNKDAIPIAALFVEIGTMIVSLEALDGEYGLGEDPQEIQLLRLTQYLMEGLDTSGSRLASLPSIDREEGGQWHSLFTDTTCRQNYGGDLRPANATENFDQLLDDQTDMAIYGHVHKQLLHAMAVRANRSLNPGTIGMPYFDWEPIQPQSTVCSDRCRRRWGDQPAIS